MAARQPGRLQATVRLVFSLRCCETCKSRSRALRASRVECYIRAFLISSQNLMISSESLSFLKKLLDTPGPSGFEAAPAKVWREHAKKFAKVSGDVAGNSLAEVNNGGTPTVMLAGHIDEIGGIVNYLDDQGFAYIQPIGGWDPQGLIGQRLRFAGRKGDVFGVVGRSRYISSSRKSARKPPSS